MQALEHSNLSEHGIADLADGLKIPQLHLVFDAGRSSLLVVLHFKLKPVLVLRKCKFNKHFISFAFKLKKIITYLDSAERDGILRFAEESLPVASPERRREHHRTPAVVLADVALIATDLTRYVSIAIQTEKMHRICSRDSNVAHEYSSRSSGCSPRRRGFVPDAVVHVAHLSDVTHEARRTGRHVVASFQEMNQVATFRRRSSYAHFFLSSHTSGHGLLQLTKFQDFVNSSVRFDYYDLLRGKLMLIILP